MALIGIAILLMSPKFVDMIKESFGVKGIAGSVIGETVGGGIAGAGLGKYIYDYKGSGDLDKAKVINQLTGIFGGKLNLPEKK